MNRHSLSFNDRQMIDDIENRINPCAESANFFNSSDMYSEQIRTREGGRKKYRLFILYVLSLRIHMEL